MTDYSILPAHMREPMRLYIEHGVTPGSFTQCVLANDLMGALGRADDTNRERIFDICRFLYNEAPAACYGSTDRMFAWINRGGLHGMTEAAE